MQEPERGDVPAAAGQRAGGPEPERAGVPAAGAGRGARERAQQQRVLRGEGGAAQDGDPGVDVGAAQVPGVVLACALPAPAGLPGRRRRHVAAHRRPQPAAAGLAGRGVHQPGERGVRVHAGARAGRRRHRATAATAGRRAHRPLPLLLLHGERDLLPPKTLSRRRLQGQVLGPLPAHSRPAVLQHVEDQLRAGVLHGGVHGVKGVWRGRAGSASARPRAAPAPRLTVGRGRAPFGAGRPS